ncbi:hypothetical protein RhiJN_17455 [Ceratobasidium sp. AG-Ba]|nr:hypothetical protein RhiJN_17455 [Ceratobasidium sp. AG-Ba]
MSDSAVLTTDDADELGPSFCDLDILNKIKSREYIACELCREPLHELSVENRQAHYEGHFSNGDGLEINEIDAQLAASERFSDCLRSLPLIIPVFVGLAQSSSPNRGAPTSVAATYHRQGNHTLKPRENMFWHPGCSSPPPSKIITPGIIPLLKQALARSKSGGALCTPLIVHYGTELWDLGW